MKKKTSSLSFAILLAFLPTAWAAQDDRPAVEALVARLRQRPASRGV